RTTLLTLLFQWYAYHRDLHSFPTRRSSDLTHTSPVQARYMEQAKGKPIAIISPGKTYRRDPDDATHSHQFMQCEGLVIGTDINLDRKSTRLNSSHVKISYAVFCLKKKNIEA